ncbi:ATP-binding cassette domain-containing protein [bacterium]|nr:ATP-binding cassette domain-containing protein [bacterium]
MSTIKPLLSVRNLTKRFGPGCEDCESLTGPTQNRNQCPTCKTILGCGEVSFDLYPNEVLGIVGESGSGKTTLLRALHFDFEVTSGEMFFSYLSENNELTDLIKQIQDVNLFTTTNYVKRKVRNFLTGIIYQNPLMGINLNISAGGNIAEKMLMAEWRNLQTIRNRSKYLFQKTEMPLERIDQSPKDFSGGMQQRVQISKALASNPVLLFLDEVTTGLDLSVQAGVLDLIRNIQREFRFSMIVISHDFGVIRLLTERCMVMKNGKVIEHGLTDQILEDPVHPYTQLLVSSQL